MIAALLGGAALGASVAALVDAFRVPERSDLGQFTFSAGAPSGGAPGSSLGPVVGPPAAVPSGPMGPMVLGPGAAVEGEDGTGPVVSVPPIVHDGDGQVVGDSFFGISAPFYFWPYSWSYWWPPRPLTLICRKREIDDEEVFVCERSHPARPVAYAWGPPAGWLW